MGMTILQAEYVEMEIMCPKAHNIQTDLTGFTILGIRGPTQNHLSDWNGATIGLV